MAVNGCSSSQNPPTSNIKTAPREQGAIELLNQSEQVHRITVDASPTFQLIERQGDPAGAISLAMAVPGGSRNALIIMALMSSRLEAAGFHELELRPSALGFVASTEVKNKAEVIGFVKATNSALTENVKAASQAMQRVKALLAAVSSEQGRARLKVDSDLFFSDSFCGGALGSDTPKETIQTWGTVKVSAVGKLLQLSSQSQRVGFGILGTPELLTALDSLEGLTWPSSGSSRADSWPEHQELKFSHSTSDVEVAIEVLTTDVASALSAAEALNHNQHSLRDRLRRLPESYEVIRTSVSLRPSGACLALHLSANGKSISGSSGTHAALTLGVDELKRTLAETQQYGAEARALLTPARAQDAAAISSWIALQDSQAKKKTQFRVLASGSALQNKVIPLQKALSAQHKKWESLHVAFSAYQEIGQAESYMLLASPCGARGDENESAGLRALSLLSLAADFSGKNGVALEPWIDQNGLGLLAHAAPRPEETAEQFGGRIARALASAFAGPALDGRDVANMRMRQLQNIGSDPGVEMITTLLSSGHLGMLAPEGLERTVAQLSTWDVERTRGDMLSEPLRAIYVSNRPDEQAAQAQIALNEWLEPVRGATTACPMPTPEPVAARQWQIETVSKQVQPGAFIGVWAPASRRLGFALAYLLNRSGGYLESVLAGTSFATGAKARWLGGSSFGGLFIALRGDQTELADATQQTRALLVRLANQGITEKDIEILQTEQKRRNALIQRSPQGRLISRFFGESEVQISQGNAPPPPARVEMPVTRRDLNGFLKEFKAERHLIVEVTRRK